MATLKWKLKSRLDTFIGNSAIFKDLLPEFISQLPEELFFVEIGANDGIEFDPLYKQVLSKKWSGVYIEPQKKVFEKLVSNFKGISNLYFENIAITNIEKEIQLYSPNDTLTNENSLIASMSSEKGVLRHYDHSELKSEIVQGKPFSYIVDKYNLADKPLTLVLIDVEGFEKEIIQEMNFNQFKPNYLIYEHAHLTYDIHRELNSFLIKNGYKIYVDKFDTLAIKL